MQKLLIGYRDNMRVEIEPGVALTAKTVADLRALKIWPDGLALNIHIDLDPRLSVVSVEWRSTFLYGPKNRVHGHQRQLQRRRLNQLSLATTADG